MNPFPSLTDPTDTIATKKNIVSITHHYIFCHPPDLCLSHFVEPKYTLGHILLNQSAFL